MDGLKQAADPRDHSLCTVKVDMKLCSLLSAALCDFFS